MRRLTGIFALLAIMFVAAGCSTGGGFSVASLNAKGEVRAHAWEEPHFTADLESNPVKSELGLGFVTLGSEAGIGDHPEGKWISLGVNVGPSKQK